MNMPLHIKEISRLLESNHARGFESILEWGMGESTALFYNAAVKYKSELFITIENHETYFISIMEKIKKNGFFHPLLVPLSETAQYPPGGNNNKDMYYYSICPLHYRRTFDLIFIDGRIRNECLLTAALLASPDAITILHDFRRVRMTPAKFLFDEVDSDFKGILILKKKPSLQPFFDQFPGSESLHLNDAPAIATYRGYKKKAADDLDAGEQADLKCALEKHYPGGCEKIVEWGTPASTRIILDHMKRFSPNHYIAIAHSVDTRDKLIGPGKNYPFWEVRAVSLIGMREQGSRDPNFHYSSCPIYFKKKFNFFYIGSERRNECMLTASLLLEKDGIVFLRDGESPHYTPGKYLFEPIDRIGNFHVLKRKAQLDDVFGKFLATLPGEARCADIDPA